MRIGFDVAQTCVERAGCGWYADSLARALAEETAGRHELILYHHFGDWVNASCARGTEIHAPHVFMPLRALDAAEAWQVWANPADPRLGRPDIIHGASVRAPRVAGAKTVFTVHDLAFWAVPQFATEANRRVCQAGTLGALFNADGLLFISQSARDEFERFLPGWIEEREMPHAIIHHGARAVPPEAATELPGGLSPSEPFWLAVGTLEPRKNYEALLAALGPYRARSASPAPLVVVGGAGWKSDALRVGLSRAEAAGAVRCLGYVDDTGLSALYRRARGLVFPSWYEGFGLPVLEALSHGCPVICSDRTSLPEVGGDAVRYVNPAAPETIVAAMLEVEETPREPRAEIGRRQAAKFTWADTAKKTLRFYAEVMARKS